MLDHPTLLSWTHETVDYVNKNPDSPISTLVRMAMHEQRSQRRTPRHGKLWLAISKQPQLTLSGRYGLDSNGQPALIAPRANSAEARMLIACVELSLAKQASTVRISKCPRKGCPMLVVGDYGTKLAGAKSRYCTQPDGTSHKLTPTERRLRHAKGEAKPQMNTITGQQPSRRSK